MDVDALWSKFLEIIKENIASLSYETWFRDTKLVSLYEKTATVIVPMPVHKKHLSENYLDIMEEKFKTVSGIDYTFSFLLEDEWEEQKDDILVNERIFDAKTTKKVDDKNKKDAVESAN